MAHPSDRYVRWVLASTWADEVEETLESVNRRLDDLRLPQMTEEQFNALSCDFAPPKGFNFDDPKHSATAAFMDAQEISFLWNPPRHWRQSRVEECRWAFHDLPRRWAAVSDVQVLLLGGVGDQVIADHATHVMSRSPKLQDVVTKFQVLVYRLLYWNPDLVSRSEWETLLANHARREDLLDALNCGAAQAKHLCGFRVAPQKPSRVLQDLHQHLRFKAEALSRKPAVRSNIAMLVAVSKELRALHRMMYGDSATFGAAEQMQQFSRVLMKHESSQVTTVDTLIDRCRGGSISGDGGPAAPIDVDIRAGSNTQSRRCQ